MATALRLGSRVSPLAMAQTRHVQHRLAAALAVPAEAIGLRGYTTTGDQIQDRPLLEAGGKGLFTKELDLALLAGEIDAAVHSLKDLPTTLPEGLALVCVPEREDPRDVFISALADHPSRLPAGSVVGTASLRRQAQTLHWRPDLAVALLRGSVQTRLARVQGGGIGATYLALAGLKRLGLEGVATAIVDIADMPPAAGQGALAIVARADDALTADRLAPLCDLAAQVAVTAERAFLAALDGSCRTPIGAHATAGSGRLAFIGEVLTPDGTRRWRRVAETALGNDPLSAAAALGRALGEEIRAEAGADLPRDAEPGAGFTAQGPRG